MTSAFIIPDITMRYPPAEITECAHQGKDGHVQHDGRSCTICRRSASWDQSGDLAEKNSAVQGTTNMIKIPKPIPVSERMPQAGPYDEEPTMRPSQPPNVALAIVMKGLEDELVHLKIMLARYQTAYEKHDASLSKQKRKALCKKMAELLKTIDTKADQIYSLYDVLEGQKVNGQIVNEDNLEMTLHSIGINISHLPSLAVEPTTDGTARRKSRDDTGRMLYPGEPDSSDDEDDEELPWEGIEETGQSARSAR